jgi:2-phosphosulfolactate phosphatase
MRIDLLLTPYKLDQVDLENKTVVVMDILRASTSICASLKAGAKGVIPVSEPGEAGALFSRLGQDSVVLAGEREGVKIENFQYGNSPAEFTPESVAGRTVILCTTNGTGIFNRASRAAHVVSGALVNVSEVARQVAAWKNDVVMVCAGREGGFSVEDTLCGGMLIDRLNQIEASDVELNDAGRLAKLLYAEMGTEPKQTVADGEHGRFLASIGMASDIDLCTAVDSVPIVPVMDDGCLVIAEPK